MSFHPSVQRLSHKVSPSSRRWLARQFKDPIVKQRLSHPDNYRSRSAFKLIELENTRHFLSHKDVQTVVDLGAAPGGWSQVVAARMGWKTQDIVGMERAEKTREAEKALSTGVARREKMREEEYKAMQIGFGLQQHLKSAKHGSWSSDVSPDPLDELGLDKSFEELVRLEGVQQGRGTVIAVDLLSINPIPGVKTLKMDLLSPEVTDYISALLPPQVQGKVDVVLSDMAANSSGNRVRDIEANMDLWNAAFQFSRKHLRTAAEVGRARGGVLVIKHFAHPLSHTFRKDVLEPNFRSVYYDKPGSSRSESSEGYWVCLGWNPRSPSHLRQDSQG